jgi:ParB/RepB/Spo0J family partition protein
MDRISQRTFELVDLSNITIDPLNARRHNRRGNLDSLKTNIAKVGLIHPVVLTRNGANKFLLIVGQRRFEAYAELRNSTDEERYKKIPAIIINNIDDAAKRLISFSENVTRGNLPYNDTIRMCDELFNSYGGSKNDRLARIAEDVGISIQTVTRYLSYRLVPEEVRKLVTEKKLDARQAYKITSIFWPKSDKITRLAKYMVGMTKPEWENLLDIGMEKGKDVPVEEIIAESKKPSRKVPVVIQLEPEDFDKIKEIAKGSENQIDVPEFITSIIREHIQAM